MNRQDFKKTSRLGCPKCYETFEEELTGLLKVIHGSTRHVGKVPEGEEVTAEILSLQKALEEAVVAQNFEEAAKLRDLIRGLGSKKTRSKRGGTGRREKSKKTVLPAPDL